MFIQIQKEVLFLLNILFAQLTEYFPLTWIVFMFIKISRKLCTIHLTVVAFKVRNIISLNGSFSIFPLAGLFKLTGYLKICYVLNIRASVLYDWNLEVFVLTPMYTAFGVIHISTFDLENDYGMSGSRKVLF